MLSVTEVRFLQMGSETSYIEELLMEIQLLHDFQHVHAVDIRDLINRSGEFTEVYDSRWIILCDL